MALASIKTVAPGDTSVGTAANRVATGTRAPGTARIEGLGSASLVTPRHEWRPAEDHGYGEHGFDRHQQGHEGALDFSPLVLRYAAAYVANQQAAFEEKDSPILNVLFADTLRGIGIYETNLRLLFANEAATPQRGGQFNRLY